jgi:hypothetical protein
LATNINPTTNKQIINPTIITILIVNKNTIIKNNQAVNKIKIKITIIYGFTNKFKNRLNISIII